MSKVLPVILSIIFIIFLAFIEPFLVFWVSYLVGIICKFAIGNILIQGLSLIGINITIDNIPLLAGVLGWIGSYFKSYNVRNRSANS